jgi:hypothetical protein
MLRSDVIIGLGGASYKFLKRDFGESIPVQKNHTSYPLDRIKKGEKTWGIAINDSRNIAVEFLNIKSGK